MKRILEIAATGLLVLSGIAVAAAAVHREFYSGEVSSSLPTAPVDVADWRRFADGGVRFGSPNATVLITVFSDFECPFCRAFHRTLQSARTKMVDSVAVSFVHYPLSYHSKAVPAAIAAECAGDQQRFEPFADLLFELQDSLGTLQWSTIAERAAVGSIVDFDACLLSSEPNVRIENGRELGRQIGVRGTPTILINEWRLSTLPGLGDLESMIRNVAHGRHPLAAPE